MASLAFFIPITLCKKSRLFAENTDGQRSLYFTKSSAPKVHQISPFFPISPTWLRILFLFRGPRGTRRASGTLGSGRTDGSGGTLRTGHPGRAGGAGGTHGRLPAAVPGRDKVGGLAGDAHRTRGLHPVQDPLPADHLPGAVGLPLDEGDRMAPQAARSHGLGLRRGTGRGTGLGRADTPEGVRSAALITLHIASFLRQRRFEVEGTALTSGYAKTLRQVLLEKSCGIPAEKVVY